MALEDNIKKCIEEKSGLFRRTYNFIRNKTLPVALTVAMGVVGTYALVGCKDSKTIYYDTSVQNKAPLFSGIILDQTWNEDATKNNAINLNDYFSDPDGDSLNFNVSGNSDINVNITSGIVSFSQPVDWYGNEDVIFSASDGKDTTNSNLTKLIVNSLDDIAFMSDRDGNNEIYTMNLGGSNLLRLTNNPADDNHPAWSPDGTKIAFSLGNGAQTIYTINRDGSNQTRLTGSGTDDGSPAWSPDGTKIAFYSDRDGNMEIYKMNADGSTQTRLTNNPAIDSSPTWSPDGTKIAFASYRDGNMEIYKMNADGTNQVNLTNNPDWDQMPTWSPDGTKIAFVSGRNGNDEIYVMTSYGFDQTRLTNNSSMDECPTWSPDGTKIAFASFRDGYMNIYIMNADGSNQTRLTDNSYWDYMPSLTK